MQTIVLKVYYCIHCNEQRKENAQLLKTLIDNAHLTGYQTNKITSKEETKEKQYAEIIVLR